MNETDLRAVLDERSVPGADVRTHLLLTNVHHRIVVRRRRRQAVAVTAAVIAVAAVIAGIAGLPAMRRHATPAVPKPSPSISTINGFPEYASGTRVIATAGPLAAGQTTLRLTFTSHVTHTAYFVRCTADGPFQILLNGDMRMWGGGCGSTFQTDDEPVNKPISLEVRFPQGPVAGFAVAVGEAVPLASYVFPPRPAALRPLSLDGLQTSGSGDVTYRTVKMLRADPADPNRAVSYTFTWKGRTALAMAAQTPGAVAVTLDGKQLTSFDWWDYEQMGSYGDTDNWPLIHPKAGQRVTLTVTPARMSGDWAVALQLPE